ncbi:hypothetical protein K466DRAFT_664550 [Polyporus arcularius HHB13444]|uniref:F-box domain-containing protein n=1 Tax=Polyporus arcularius HHB13444 TaxID=1314778 RepID=A0A5C3P7X2_9APHY|nr:hypothetical protein K466DRAFT_664550 [Polyporus arcularius HHB13444]
MIRSLSADDGLAPEDRVCVTGLNHVQVQSWSLLRIEEYKARICALSFVHNTAAPINHYLPPEVLTRIFGFLHPDSYHQLQYLRVCRQWRALMLHTPRFWADILSAVPLDMECLDTSQSRYRRFEFFLGHSSPRPFDITLRGFSTPAMEALAPHTHRLRSMTLSIKTSQVEHLDRLLAVGMPLLEHLSIVQLLQRVCAVAKCDGLSATPIHLSASKYPRLHTLRIARPLFTTVNAVPTIRDLVLTNWECSCTDGLYWRTRTLTPLLDALDMCPAIETVHVKNSLPPLDADPPTPAPGRIVCLPALRDLNIEGDYLRTSKFLSHIDYPPTASVAVAGIQFWHDSDNFKRALPPDLTRFHPVAHATEVSLKFGHTIVLATYAGGCPLLTYTVTGSEQRRSAGDRSMRYVSELANIFAPVRTITVLSIFVEMLLDEDWVRLLRALPNLVSLDSKGGCGVPGLLPSLSWGSNTEGCLCPALEELAFYWNYNNQFLCHKDHQDDFIRTLMGQMRMFPVGRRGSDAEAERLAGKWKLNRSAWEAEKWHPSYPAVTVFRSVMAAMLKNRAEHGTPLKVLSVYIPEPRLVFLRAGLWGTEELKERLGKGLEGLVGQLNVMYVCPPK